jgi:hypothetical protein
MLVAVSLNLASFFAVMAPAWDNVGEGGVSGLSTVGYSALDCGWFNHDGELLDDRRLSCVDAAYATG